MQTWSRRNWRRRRGRGGEGGGGEGEGEGGEGGGQLAEEEKNNSDKIEQPSPGRWGINFQMKINDD